MVEKSTILLVEDNETNLILFEDILTLQGYNVQIARNGYEALESLERSVPDLILMDIQLPELDGLSVIRTIRNCSRLNEVTIIGLSALAMDQDIERAMEVGCDGYLTKPVSIKRLLQKVEAYLKK